MGLGCIPYLPKVSLIQFEFFYFMTYYVYMSVGYKYKYCRSMRIICLYSTQLSVSQII